jgi:hypothetical protein
MDFERRATRLIQDMFGCLELFLLTYEGERRAGEDEDDVIWRETSCPILAAGFCTRMQRFAAEILGISSTAGAVIELMKLHCIWNRRKTKAGTEGRSLQERFQGMVGKLKDSIEGAIAEDEWRRTGKQFGE